MDQPFVAAIAIGGFLAGWWARDLAVVKPEVPPCKCLCNCNTVGTSQETSWVSNGLIIVVVLLGSLLIFSNAALAFRFSYRDSDSGKRHEFSVGVKGKKGGLGIYGVPKGLQLTDG